MTCPCGLPVILEVSTTPDGQECYVYHMHSDTAIEEVRRMTSYSEREAQ